MTTTTIEQYKLLLREQHAIYYAKSAAYMSSIPTSTYVLTVLTLCLPFIFLLIIYEWEESILRKDYPKGCRKLGMNIDSNLSNEFEKSFSEGRPPSTEETSAEWWRLKSMWIYPVKSCRGVELNKGTVVAYGMEYDRQFTFAQLKSPFPVSANTPEKEKAAHKWSFITQREYPLLAQVQTEIWVPDHSSDTYAVHHDEVQSSGMIVLSFPHQVPGWSGFVTKWRCALLGRVPHKRFSIPYNPTSCQIQSAGYTMEDVTIWKEKVNALNVEIDLPEELRFFLGMSNKLGLFRINSARLREVHRNAPTKEDIGYQPVTGFQDAYPLHLINLASVRDVESKMPYVKGAPRLSATRFRANLVITGPEAYNEDTWKRIKIGWYEYDVSARMARCKMPNVDQCTGERHPSEPDKTLRRERAVDPGAGPHIGCLGMSLVPVAKDSALRVGDEIVVLEHGEHHYIHQ